MTSLLLAAATAPMAYGFGPETKLTYDVQVGFDGFLPVLGGNQGKVEVTMAVDVRGLTPEGDDLRASNEITAFEIVFNGAKLPLSLENAVEYFPKTTVRLTPAGKIVGNDAPDRRLPVRLPGLDVKRFPDITYIPIELAAGEAEVGHTWEFKRAFGDSDMDYSCRLDGLEGDLARVAVKIRQEYTVLENSALEVVGDRADAEAEVRTVLEGTGTVTFDLARGVARLVEMANEAVSTVKPLDGSAPKERRLKTVLRVEAKSLSGFVVRRPQTADRPWWEQAWGTAQAMGRDPRLVLGFLKMAAAFGLRAVPREWAAWIGQVAPQAERWLRANAART
jgi:hypothetical protein